MKIKNIALCIVSAFTLNMATAQTPPPQLPPPPPMNVKPLDIEKLLSFLPKVVATYDSGKITGQDIKDLIVPQLKNFPQRASSMTQEILKSQIEKIATDIINNKLMVMLAEKDDYKIDLKAADKTLATQEQIIGKDKFAQQIKMMETTREKIVKTVAQKEMVNKWIEEKIKPSVSVTDEELKKYYKDNPTQFLRKGEAVSASHILIKVPQGCSDADKAKLLKKIKNIRKQILAGKDFGELAEKFSECPSGKRNKGSLGEFTHGAMVPEFDKVAFELKEGDISDIVTTSFGYHIIKVDKKFSPGKIDFATVKDKLRQYLQRPKLQEKIQKMLKDAFAAQHVKFTKIK